MVTDYDYEPWKPVMKKKTKSNDLLGLIWLRVIFEFYLSSSTLHKFTNLDGIISDLHWRYSFEVEPLHFKSFNTSNAIG